MEVRAEISGVYAGLGSFVVMYILWPAVTSISLSPSLTYNSQNNLIISCFIHIIYYKNIYVYKKYLYLEWRPNLDVIPLKDVV